MLLIKYDCGCVSVYVCEANNLLILRSLWKYALHLNKSLRPRLDEKEWEENI